MKYSIELYRDRKKQHRFRIRHRNGRIILASSEGYRRRVDALRGLTRLLDAPREQFRLATLAKGTKRKAVRR